MNQPLSILMLMLLVCLSCNEDASPPEPSPTNDTTKGVLGLGDIAVVGFSSDISECFGGNGKDRLSFVTFKDIEVNQYFFITDNGYEKEFAQKWGNIEGILKMTRTGSTIEAGTVITIEYPELTGFIQSISPDNEWGFSETRTGLNMNVKGDQLYFIKDADWDYGIENEDNAIYSNIQFISAFNSRMDWESLQDSTTHSALHPAFDGCFNIALNDNGETARFAKYTGSMDTGTQNEWIDRISNLDNWTYYEDCEIYDSASPQYKDGIALPINPNGNQPCQ